MQTCYTEPYLFLAELKIFSFVEKDRGYKMKKIAVLVPCYNEELTIANVIEDFHQHLPEADIYVYDNNSSDKTAQVALEHGAIVVPEYQQGKAMLCAACSVISMRIATSWSMGTTPIRRRTP